jgi:hypothetical protein
MTNMLEQAVIDAKSLREAAMKSAEASIVEKYSEEVKAAVSRILEQEEDPATAPEDPTAEGDPLADNTAMENVPMSHTGTASEDDVVVVDLDDIIAAAESEDEGEEFELDKEEIADEIGINLGDAVGEEPANRNDEVDIDEDELVTMFKEMLTVDVPEVELERAEERLNKDEVEEDETETKNLVSPSRNDGMDKEDVKESKKLRSINNTLRQENKNYFNLLEKVKSKLEELNLQNARLLYANRVWSDSSLNEQQKNKIVELVANARSVEEAKMVVETLHKTMASSKSAGPQSLSEVISKRSSVILGGNRRDEHATDGNPTYNRWATLAGTSRQN